MKMIKNIVLSLLLASFLTVPAVVEAVVECASGYRCKDTEEYCSTACEGAYVGYVEDCDDQYIGLDYCCQCAPEAPLVTSKEEILAVIGNIAMWLYTIALTIGVIMLILGGISFMTAGGDEDKLAAARGKVVYGIVGIAIALLAWGIKSLLISFLKP